MPKDSTPDNLFSRLLKKFHHDVDRGRTEDVEATVSKVFQHAEDWCDENPSPDFDLTIAAGECEEVADWNGAELAYRQILALLGLEASVESKALSDLASLYRLTNRESDALHHSRLATAAARRWDASVWLAMMLQSEARQLLRSGQIVEARQSVSEALSVIDNDKMYDHMRASLITLRAQCEVESDELEEADDDLAKAYTLMQPMADFDIAAGVQSDLAKWWTAHARLCRASNDHEKAIDAWQNAVAIGKQVASTPHAENVYTKVAVADMLAGLADSLARCGRMNERATTLAERNALLEIVGVEGNR